MTGKSISSQFFFADRAVSSQFVYLNSYVELLEMEEFHEALYPEGETEEQFHANFPGRCREVSVNGTVRYSCC